MLKWAVNKRNEEPETLRLRRRSANEIFTENIHVAKRRRFVKDHKFDNKENRFTSSTPYKPHSPTIAPIRNVLRDVSNTTPTRLSTTTQPHSSATTKTLLYASTLPTFDIEYSPCESLPFTISRGLEKADPYCDNPRYFPEESSPVQSENCPTPLSSRLSGLRFSQMSYKRNPNNNIEEDSLNSSKVGDLTLDKMIDDILKSVKKPPKRSTKAKRKLPTFYSPSYKAGDDPASDLNTYKDHLILSPAKFIEAVQRTIILEETRSVNEREIKTPEFTKVKRSMTIKSPLNACNLRRQKAVRRRNKTQSKNSSASGKESPATPFNLHNISSSTIDELAGMKTPEKCNRPKKLDLNLVIENDQVLVHVARYKEQNQVLPDPDTSHSHTEDNLKNGGDHSDFPR